MLPSPDLRSVSDKRETIYVILLNSLSLSSLLPSIIFSHVLSSSISIYPSLLPSAQVALFSFFVAPFLIACRVCSFRERRANHSLERAYCCSLIFLVSDESIWRGTLSSPPCLRERPTIIRRLRDRRRGHSLVLSVASFTVRNRHFDVCIVMCLRGQLFHRFQRFCALVSHSLLHNVAVKT